MSRLSFRPRPLDIHKKLPIVKSVKDLDNDEGPSVSRSLPHGHTNNVLDGECELVCCTVLPLRCAHACGTCDYAWVSFFLHVRRHGLSVVFFAEGMVCSKP